MNNKQINKRELFTDTSIFSLASEIDFPKNVSRIY